MESEHETSEPIVREIIHIDINAFLASVGQLDNPELRVQSIAIIGEEIRNIIFLASYEVGIFETSVPFVVTIYVLGFKLF